MVSGLRGQIVLGRAEALDAYSARSDADLIALMRTQGDALAYETLRRRHVGAASVVARRMTSVHADDLVSEAFQAVHHNVVRAGAGPQDAFRPYLFQVMRNIDQVQPVVATPLCWSNSSCSLNASAGVFQSSVLRGLVLSA